MSELTNQSPVRVINLEGKVRMGESVDRFRAAVEDSLQNGHARIVVDFSHVTMLDSSGIGVLVRSLTLAKQKGGTIKICGAGPNVAQSLKVTGVVRLFESFPDAFAARDSFGPA